MSLLASVLLLAATAYANPPGYYGSAVAMDGLANLTIGANGDGQVAVRFMAQHTGNIDVIVQQYQNVTPGYMGGTGGQIKWELRTDDGTANHFPSSTVLWSTIDTSPTKTKSGTVIQWFDLSPSVPVTAGTLYHIVYTNVDPSPNTNYVSFDGIYTQKNSSPVQPAYADSNLVTLWGGPNWTENLHITPEFNVHYSDGYVQGTGYVDSTSISGSASEVFTVSGGNQVVTGVSAAGGTGLYFSLTSGGATIISGTGSSGSYPNWTTYTFPSPITLVNGQTYTLTVSGAYRAVQKGKPYGMYTSFTDGYYAGNSAYDLEFYFTTVASGTAALPPPTNLNVAGSGATQATLAWAKPATATPAGYKLYWGTVSGNYTSNVKAGNVLRYTVQGLSAGTTYYFAATDYDATGNESARSNEVSWTCAATCAYALSPASQTVAAAGGSGAVSVTAQGSNCSWGVSGAPSWITIASGGTGTSSGTVNYTVAANTASSSRSAGLTVAGHTFTVTQGGAAVSSYTIAASAGSGGSISPSGSVQVKPGASQSFSIAAAQGHSIGSVVVDGQAVGALSSYTFSKVNSNHTISVSFKSRWW